MNGDVATSAILSDCGLYRYELRRAWRSDDWATFVMLNPSTADADHDDPTIRKCTGFAQRWGCGGFTVVNLFALRSTNPKGLVGHPDPNGPDNAVWLSGAIDENSGPLVAAWGASFPKVHADEVMAWTRWLRSVNARCLGKTKDGHPRHPLMLTYATQLEAL